MGGGRKEGRKKGRTLSLNNNCALATPVNAAVSTS